MSAVAPLDPFANAMRLESQALAREARHIGDLRDDVAELYRDSLFALAFVSACVRTLTGLGQGSPRDPSAERAVIAALLLGSATPEDVAELEPADLSPNGWALLCAAVACLEAGAVPTLERVSVVAGSLASRPPGRVRRALEALLVDVPGIPEPAAPVLRLRVLTRQRRAIADVERAARELRSVDCDASQVLGHLRAAARALAGSST